MPKLKAAFQEADGAAMLAELTQTNQSSLTIEGQLIPLDQDDVEVRLQANEGWAAAQGPQAVIVLATELTPELIRSGLARDVNRLVQDRRKELDLERSDSIELNLVTESDDLKQAILENSDYLMGETLATHLGDQEPSGALAVKECNVGDGKLQIFIKVTGEVDA